MPSTAFANLYAWVQRRSQTIELVLIGAGLLILFFYLPHHVTGDGYLRLRALRRLVNLGKLPSMGQSMIGPLLALPFYLLGGLYQTPEWWCARFNFFVFALCLLLFYWMLRNHLDRSVVRKFLLILIGGSMFLNHLQDFYGEVFTSLTVGIAILATQLNHPQWGWGGMVVGSLNTPASMLGMAGVALAESVKKRHVRYLLVPVAAAGVFLLYSWLRRGSFFTTGYEGNVGRQTILTYSGKPGFSYPFFFGLFSVLLSFGKGILFFAPGLLLSFQEPMATLKEKLRRTYHLWLWFLFGLVLVYCRWWAWYGGWTWGPRFFLFASIPASFALAVSASRTGSSLRRDLLVLVILGLSFWVGISGGIFGLDHLEDCRDAEFEFLCWYVPEYSVLWRPFVVRDPLEGKEIVLLSYAVLVLVYLEIPVFCGLAGPLRRRFLDLRSRYLDWKQWRF